MKTNRVVVIHGILTHGETSVDKLGLALEKEGYEVIYHEYPMRGALGFYLPWRRRTDLHDARVLLNAVSDGAHVIAHSYGALIWQASIELGAKWGNCFIFGGACTSDSFEYPDDCLSAAAIFYNPKDIALKGGALLPWHLFGKLGLRGFAGTPTKIRDSRFTNVAVMSKGLTLGHSHYFNEFYDKSLNYILGELKGAQ